MSQSGSACFASTVTGVQSLGLMGKATEQGSMCHRLSAGQAEAGGPGLLASQPSLFGELQASDGLLLKTNKQRRRKKNRGNLELFPGFSVPGMWFSGRAVARHGQSPGFHSPHHINWA